jgi:hypothetical protein
LVTDGLPLDRYSFTGSLLAYCRHAGLDPAFRKAIDFGFGRNDKNGVLNYQCNIINSLCLSENDPSKHGPNLSGPHCVLLIP